MCVCVGDAKISGGDEEHVDLKSFSVFIVLFFQQHAKSEESKSKGAYGGKNKQKQPKNMRISREREFEG